MRTDQFTFAATPAGLLQREHLAASLLSVGRTVRLFRETCAGFELLMLEAGPRAGEGQIAAAMKAQSNSKAHEMNWSRIRTHADDQIEDFNSGRR
jgi:hypothetical protein